MFRYPTTRVAVAAALLAVGGAAEAAGARYFSFITYSGDPTHAPNEFVVEVRDAALAERYARIAGNVEKQPHVAFIGKVVPGRAPYNEGWAFHVDPTTLKPPTDASFHECSSRAEDVEENLGAVGGAILPGGVWCPWTMHLSREVKR